MAYVKIEFPQLWVTKADHFSMYIIGYFLTDDVGCRGGKAQIDWILDDRYDHISHNRTFVAKDNDKIIMADLYTDDSCDESLSVPTLALIDLLKKWDEVCKTNPEEVTIYYENEKFRIEAKLRAQDQSE